MFLSSDFVSQQSPDPPLAERTVKQEEVYLKGYQNVSECKEGLRAYFDRYNNIREHQSLDYNYPAEIYFGNILLKAVA